MDSKFWKIVNQIRSSGLLRGRENVAKANRVAKSKEDLKHELREQLQLLKMSCEAFDKGVEAAGKQIALSLRLLLHLHGRSRALLDLLGYRSGKFISSAVRLDDDSILITPPILMMRVSAQGIQWLPHVASSEPSTPVRYLPFSEWWLEPILKDKRGHTFDRMTLVQHVANTDGGAHVDPDLDAVYMELSRNNSLGWTFGPDALPLKGRVELACMRQIAHELLSTLHEFVPEFSEAAKPVIPASTVASVASSGT